MVLHQAFLQVPIDKASTNQINLENNLNSMMIERGQPRGEHVREERNLRLSSTTRLVTPSAVSVVICTGPKCRVGKPCLRSSAVRSRGGSSPIKWVRTRTGEKGQAEVVRTSTSIFGSAVWAGRQIAHPGFPEIEHVQDQYNIWI